MERKIPPWMAGDRWEPSHFLQSLSTLFLSSDFDTQKEFQMTGKQCSEPITFVFLSGERKEKNKNKKKTAFENATR